MQLFDCLLPYISRQTKKKRRNKAGGQNYKITKTKRGEKGDEAEAKEKKNKSTSEHFEKSTGPSISYNAFLSTATCFFPGHYDMG